VQKVAPDKPAKAVPYKPATAPAPAAGSTGGH
jgi:hypothetical protein